ncbi:MAG: DUF2812 domain-containing protein [Spirochaetales bacterium]|nr:DUF2812 domain-containing protein [Spirochaetales bacterium]
MMKKRVMVRFFTIPEYERECLFLQEQHRQGWKLVSVYFPGIYLFEACEPEEVVYQLDFNEEGRKELHSYVQIFKDCGWEYLFSYMGYSYFRKPMKAMQQQESIFCDDASRLDMMRRVFKSRMIPLVVLFALVILPQTFLQASQRDGSLHSFFFYTYVVLFVFYLYIFVRFFLHYRKLSRS